MQGFRLRIAAIGCSLMVAAAQQSPAPQRPIFRASMELVAVDVTVLDRDSAPVKDLAAADFVVRVDGQPRRIASLQFVDESSRPGPTASALPIVSSNAAGAGGRFVLIVVDEGTIRFGGVRAAMESIDRLLAGFGPSDRIGLATLPGPRMLVQFSRDRQRIMEAVKRIPAGSAPVSLVAGPQVGVAEAFSISSSVSGLLQAVVERECGNLRGPSRVNCEQDVEATAAQVVNQARNQTAEFVLGLRSLLLAVRQLDVPKILILFSGGIECPDAPRELSPLSYEAAAARTVIHVMRLDQGMFDVASRGVSRDAFLEDQDLARASLDSLAGASRGTTFEITGSSQVQFERLAREVSGYYLLGIEPEGNDRDGKPHRIQVNTVRPGLTLRARPEFTFTPATTVADPSKLLAATLQSPAIATGIPLRVMTVNLADEDSGKVRVMVLAEIDRGQQKGGAAQVGYVIVDDRGKVLAGLTQQADLARTPSGALAFTGVSAVAQGTYTLKLAAVRDGRAGSVEHSLTATLTHAAPFRLGDLLVRNLVRGQGPFAPSLDPVVSGDALMGFVQLRVDRDVPRDAALALEIVKEENGPVLVSVPATLSTSRGSVRTAQASLDARLLPPGDYGARLAVSVAGRPAGTVFTRFSLERAARDVASPAPFVAAAQIRPFQLDDVLAPAALAPFLDELAAGATPDVAAAIEKARQAKLEEAAQELKADAAGDPRPPFIRGLALLGRGQLRAASDAFRAAMRADPEFLLGAFFIGTCYAAGGQEEQAMNAWQTSLLALDHFPLVYRLLSDALMRAGRPERAAELLEEAVERWPEDEALQLRGVRAAFDAGHYERVWQVVDRIAGQRQMEPALLFLAMEAVLQAVIDRGEAPTTALLERLQRYRDLYAAAGGPQQALVAEWVAFLQRRVGQ